MKNENIESDYQKGVFLHLITDYLFFNNFFEYKYLKNISYLEFCKDLYYSYDLTNQYLKEKYEINYSQLLKDIKDNILKSKTEKNVSNETRKNIIPFTKLEKFIEYVSDIEFENYKSKIINSNSNILQ